MRTISTLALCLFGACAAEDPPNEEVASALDGTVTTSGCTTAQRGKIVQAIQLIRARLDAAETYTCFANAFIGFERHDMLAEQIANLLGQRPTEIECTAQCTNGDTSCASVPPWGQTAPEWMRIQRTFVDSASIPDIAGAITHAATKSLGFPHPVAGHGRQTSAPVQAASCLRSLQPDGLSRAAMRGENETSPVGGGGGMPFFVRCPVGTTVTAITADTSTFVNRLQLRCGSALLPAIGSFFDSTRTETHQCAPGWSLTGSTTWSDSMLRLMISQCTADAQLVANATNPPRQAALLGGAGFGAAADRACPVGMAIVGATGRAGARIDQLRWLCRDIDGVSLPHPFPIGVRGFANGVMRDEQCTGLGPMVGLYGRTGAEVDLLGGACMASHRPNGVLAIDFTAAHGLAHNGGQNGTEFTQWCQFGLALVGLRLRTDTRVKAIAAVCAEPTTWLAGGGVALRHDLVGGTTGALSEVLCPNRTFMTGIRTWSTNTPDQFNHATIHGVEPICRALE